MALGLALTLAGALLAPLSECRFVVLGMPEPLSEFLTLVNLYRQGRPDEAAARLSSVPPDELKYFRSRVLTVRDMAAPGPRRTAEPEDSCLVAAALLATELAMTEAERSRWEDADAHSDEAWQISFLIEVPSDRYRFQRDWLLAAGLFHHRLIFVNKIQEAFMRADRYLQSAVRLFPSDPELLLAEASLLEWSGSLRGGDPAHLREAEDLYSRVLRLAPADPEGLLRHGSVLDKLGREEEAAASLSKVLELGAREDHTYRARMTLGGIAERKSRVADAIAHYEAAAHAIPSWQVAYVALGHALHSSGAHERSREVLGSALLKSANSIDEAFGGWWGYELGITYRLDPLLERMRAEVMR